MITSRAAARVRRLIPAPAGRIGDVAFGVAVIGTALVALAVTGGGTVTSDAALAGVLAAVCGCAAAARRAPIAATLVASPFLFASALLPSPAQSVGEAILLVGVFPLIYRLATRAAVGATLTGTVMIAGSWQGGGLWHSGAEAFNPSIVFSTIGPCVVGLIAHSRGRAGAQLETQARELAQAQQAYTEESLRYERIRIARELHDIVAHYLSAMVVQANAGQRLASRDPALAAEAFDHIERSAHQATEEIGRLVALLEPHSATPPRSITELLSRVRATGVDVDYRSPVALSQADPSTADIAYAVVQEGLTNALKHAPGAAIHVVVQASPHRLTVLVTNTPAQAAGLELAGTGGGYGLTGLRERVTARGGTFAAHATADGGWQLAADLPAATFGDRHAESPQPGGLRAEA